MSKKSCVSSGERCKRGFANGRGLNGRLAITFLKSSARTQTAGKSSSLEFDSCSRF